MAFRLIILCSLARLRVDTSIYLSISARQEGRSSMHSALKAQNTALQPVNSGKAPVAMVTDVRLERCTEAFLSFEADVNP